MHYTVRAAEAGDIFARPFATVAYGVARSGRGESLGALFAALARAAERRLNEFKPQDFAITAWSFATVGQLDEDLFAALARTAKRRVSDFNV